MSDVKRLMQIHSSIGGPGQGRRYGLEVLNRSAVVFLASSWEAFVEDVAVQAMDHLVNSGGSYNSVPLPMKKAAAKVLKDSLHELQVWDLAGDGWKEVVVKCRDNVLRQEIAPFNTPKPQNVDNLFQRLLGIKKISDHWYWQGMSKARAHAKLKKFIGTRGAIAHRGRLPQSITREYVERHLQFINRIAVKTSNMVRDHVKTKAKSYPWKRAAYEGFH